MNLNHITLDEVDSTNNYLKQHRSELPDGTLVTAGLQTAGKGRRGHGWLADRGMLPFSLLLKNPPYPETLTLCAAVAVCKSLEQLLPDEKFGIKWPNDIILHGHKLCGILCESVYFGSSMDVICGIGVNISQTWDFFCNAGIPHGGSLKMLTGVEPDREALAGDIARRLYDYSRKGFPAVSEEYTKRCLTIEKQVLLIENGIQREAFAEGIAPNGFLIC
ncbi:MAG: biotin--[acetyl-CoA-carboxylase] ligase, partial [Oscillospiraceae bacterium]